jgi:hypothetical protein
MTARNVSDARMRTKIPHAGLQRRQIGRQPGGPAKAGPSRGPMRTAGPRRIGARDGCVIDSPGTSAIPASVVHSDGSLT